MHTVEIILLVLLLGALTGIAARYLTAVPLPLIQIAIGAAVSWPQEGLHIALDPELFLLLFIPPLLFADGWRIPKREFFALFGPILRLAFALVFVTVLGLGFLIHWMIPSMPLPVAFALAAVVSPTDAVAVSAITRKLGMPPGTMRLLEGESLLNDASGLVALKFAVAATLTGAFSWLDAGAEFLWVAAGGVAVGALLGWVFAFSRGVVTRRLGDVAATQMVMLLLLLPFATYIVAEHIGVSGILAVVAAGVTTNMADLDRGEFVTERLQTMNSWVIVESAFNGAIFLLLGLQLPGIVGGTLAMHGDWGTPLAQVLGLGLGLLALRWLWLTLSMRGPFWRRRRGPGVVDPPSRVLTLVATLAGIRGAVTLAGALSVPLLLPDGAPFPAREQLIFLATGTILFTLVAGSIGLPLLLRRLPPSADAATMREDQLARLEACRAVNTFLAQPPDPVRATDQRWLERHTEAIERVALDYAKRIEVLEDVAAEASEAEVEAAAARLERHRIYVAEMELRLAALKVERAVLYRERQANRINDETLRSLVGELDLTEVSLRRRLVIARRRVRLAEGPASER